MKAVNLIFVNCLVTCYLSVKFSVNIHVVFGMVMHFRNYKSLADIFRYILFR